MLKIILANNEVITDNKCNWKNLPWLPIKSIEYFIKKQPIIYMEGFDNYLYTKNYSFFISGGKGENIDGINLLGKHKNYIYQFSIDFRKGIAMQRTGKWPDTVYKPLVWNPVLQKMEWGKAQPTNLKDWHIGILGNVIIKRN